MMMKNKRNSFLLRKETWERKERNKKGVSPVITTILLMLLVIILAVIIFLWASTFIGETISKKVLNVEKAIDKFCPEVELEASYDSIERKLYIVNKGNVPVYSVNIKKIKIGDSELLEVNQRLEPGADIEANFNKADWERIKIIPVLLGKADKKKKTYICPEENSYELELSAT